MRSRSIGHLGDGSRRTDQEVLAEMRHLPSVTGANSRANRWAMAGGSDQLARSGGIGEPGILERLTQQWAEDHSRSTNKNTWIALPDHDTWGLPRQDIRHSVGAQAEHHNRYIHRNSRYHISDEHCRSEHQWWQSGVDRRVKRRPFISAGARIQREICYAESPRRKLKERSS
jgi:hypothetical protein